jgi:hypothetical protein
MVTRDMCSSMRKQGDVIILVTLLIMSKKLHSLGNLIRERGHPLRCGVQKGTSIDRSQPYPQGTARLEFGIERTGNRETRAIGIGHFVTEISAGAECWYVYFRE